MSKRKRVTFLRVAIKGFMDILPLNLAVIPWGVLCGSLAIQRGFSPLEALLMPLLVFAGSAQLVATELIANNVPLGTILFTTFIISSRHFLYGLAFRDKYKKMSAKWRLSLGFLLTDELFALSTSPKAFTTKLRLVYALAVGGFFYLSWLIFNIVGIFAGSYLPDLTEIGLDFAIAVTFIALVIPTINTWPAFVTVCTAGICSIIFSLLHWELGLVLSSIIAMSFGYMTMRYIDNRKALQVMRGNNS